MSAGRRIRGAAIAGLTLIGLSSGVYFGAHRALQHKPDFYARAVSIPAADQQQAGQDFERNVLGLHNDLHEAGKWKRVFTDSQINGWLAVDLPQKFPELLPPSIREPRIALTPGELRIAFEYEDDQLSTIVSLSMDVTLAEEPNTLAIRIHSARAGWVPIPLKDFLDQISAAARRADISLRWAQRDGDPVALITVPDRSDEDELKQYVLELIHIGDGEVAIAGRSLVKDND